MNLPKLHKGFTLIELLLVIAILSVLLVVVFASLNPTKRLADTNNARRWNDVNQILTAIHECLVDNSGSLTACGLEEGGPKEIVNGTITTGCKTVCTGVADVDSCTNLSTLTTQHYIASLPTDPAGPEASHTSYSVNVDNGIVTIAACGAEAGQTISVSR